MLKVALAYLAQGEHGLADEFVRRASTLLEQDIWVAGGGTSRSDARKHVACAQRLQGEILAARGRPGEAVEPVRASIALAETLGTPREVWIGKAALGRVLADLGRDKDAELQFAGAADAIEAIAAKPTTPRLRQRFLTAEPVVGVFDALSRRHRTPDRCRRLPATSASRWE